MAFHLYHITEVFSNADGSVQFIELRGELNGQNFLSGRQISVTQGATTRTYTFNHDVATNTLNKSILIATQGYAELAAASGGTLPAPDFIISDAQFPNGFLFLDGGTIRFPATGTNDTVTYGALPTDGVTSLMINEGTITEGTNAPRNFAGATGSIVPNLEINGNDDPNVFSGGAGNDTLSGLGGNDELFGLGGNDSIDGGADNDTLDGGTGNDTLLGGPGIGDDMLTGGDGNDFLDGGEGNDNLLGGAGNDELLGVEGGDVLNGGDGNDTLDGGADSDTLDGGAGNDVFLYESATELGASEFILGGNGNDVVRFTAISPQTLVLRPLTEVEEVVIGNESGDTSSTIGGVNVDASAANQNGLRITGNEGTNVITGTALDDVLIGNGGIDALVGGDGDDIFLMGDGDHLGSETVSGGSGNNVIRFTSTITGTLTLTSNVSGISTVAISDEGGAITGVAALNVAAGNYSANGLTIIGNNGNNQISGTIENDSIVGNAGVDSLEGSGGNDTLNGGAGADNLQGGEDDDLLLLGSVAEFAAGEVLNGGGGDDVLRYTGATGGNLILTGNVSGIELIEIGNAAVALSIDATAVDSAELILTGNNAANTLTGNGNGNDIFGGAGNDVLNGGGGTDLLVGEAGNDALNGGADNDRVVTGTIAEFGTDTVNGGAGDDWLLFTSTIEGQTLTLVAARTLGIERVVVGNESAVTTGTTALSVNAANVGNALVIIGNDGANTLTGTAQADEITGNAGDDSLAGGGGNDTLIGGLGNDTLNGGAGVDSHDGGDGNDSFVIGTPTEHAAGESINGGNDTDTLFFSGSTAGQTLVLLSSVTNVEFAQISGNLAVNLDASDVTTVNMTVNGNAAANTLTGNDLGAILNGNGGNDVLIGGAVGDDLRGGAGNDTLNGGAGGDAIFGGDGNDVIVIESGAHHSAEPEGISGGDIPGGFDVIRFTSTTPLDLLQIQANSIAYINEIEISDAAGNNNGMVMLNVDASLVDNLAFGDTGLILRGNNAVNELTATQLDDTVVGGGGADALAGEAGNDIFVIGNPTDYITGEDIDGGDGIDTIRFAGTAAGQTLMLQASISSVERADIATEAGVVTALGLNINASALDGDIALTGNNGVNILTGGTGNNTLEGRGGNDQLIGGDGSDTAAYTTATSAVNVNLATGKATGGAGADTLVSIERVVGSGFNDTLTGSTAGDNLDGAGGNDIISGGAGIDVLQGGEGNDVLIGGADNDSLLGGNGTDTADYSGAPGAVVVDLSINNATNDGAGGADGLSSIENVIGSALDDFLTGNALANVLTGGAGMDDMVGGDGDDLFVITNLAHYATGEEIHGDGGTDTIWFTSPTAGHTFTPQSDVVLTGIERVVLANAAGMTTGTTALNVDWSSRSDAISILGNSGINTLKGGTAADTLAGGAGRDNLQGNDGQDILLFGGGDLVAGEITNGGNDFDTVRYTATAAGTFALTAAQFLNIEAVYVSDADGNTGGTTAINVSVAGITAGSLTLVGNNGNNTLTGTNHAGGDGISGNGGNDVLNGGGGGDEISGGDGNDTLVGGAGDDALYGEDGNDVFIVNAGNEMPVGEDVDGGDDFDTIRFTSASTATGHLVLSDEVVNVEAVVLIGPAGVAPAALNVDASAVGNGLAITGNAAANVLIGTDSGDTLRGGLGADLLQGGDGTDIVVVTSSAEYAGDAINGGLATDRLYFTSTVAATLVLNASMTGMDIVAIANDAGDNTGIAAINVNAAAVLGAGISLDGNNGANMLTGSAGADDLRGFGGNDVLVGGAGQDGMEGGAGIDVFLIASGAHHQDGESIAGNDGGGLPTGDVIRFISNVANDTLTLSSGVEEITEVEASDAAGGNAGAAAVNINASGVTSSPLIITGNAGANELTGTDGNDTINGNAGNDTLIGGGGQDSVNGGLGNDRIVVSVASFDDADGGAAGSDTLALVGALPGGQVSVNLSLPDQLSHAGEGSPAEPRSQKNFEHVDASEVAGANLGALGNGAGNLIIGTALGDGVSGDGGNDTLVGGTSSDTLDGGNDSDSFLYATGSEFGASEVVIGGDGASVDIIRFTRESGTDILTLSSSVFGIEQVVIGTATGVTTGIADLNVIAVDVGTKLLITGNNGANLLAGTSGNDTLNGNGGNDTLIGGAGTDMLQGGAGDDTYELEVSAGSSDLADVIVDTAGTDHVEVAGVGAIPGDVSYTLPGGIENGTMENLGDHNGSLTGNTLNNLLIGSSEDGGTFVLNGAAGNDTLIGSTNQDTLIGGAGNDSLDGGEGQDSVNGGAGNDRVTMLVTAGNVDAADGGALESDTLVLTGIVGGNGIVVADLSLPGDQVLEIGGVLDNLLSQTGFEHVDGSGLGSALNVFGGGAANSLVGSDGNDTLNGGEGADTLAGGAGVDQMSGGDANDVFLIGAAADYAVGESILGGAGTGDVIRFTSDENGEGLNLQAGLVDGIEQVVIGNAAGVTTGMTDLDVNALNATFGNPGVTGLVITGNSGENNLTGTVRNDTLVGGGGDDTLNGAAGMDMLSGGLGNDLYVLEFQAVLDTISPEAANGGVDTVQAEVAALNSYTLGANLENLILLGSSDANGIGNTLNNKITGNGGSNTLNGGDGNDTLIGGFSNDALNGGTGIDTADYSGATGGTVVDLLLGTASNDGDGFADTLIAVENVTGSMLADSLTGNNGNNVLEGADGNDSLSGGIGNDSLFGGTGNDSLTGGSGNDALGGGSGNDTLIGDAGNDILDGFIGADSMTGGLGDDTYFLDDAGDQVAEASGLGSGIDTIIHESVNQSYVLAANIENLEVLLFNGEEGVSATGNDLNNILRDSSSYVSGVSLFGLAGNDLLIGGAPQNFLNGGAGKDTLMGGAGNDFYNWTLADDATDVLSEGLNQGNDTVNLNGSAGLANFAFVLPANFETVITHNMGDKTATVTGNSLDNILSALDGKAVFNGGAGNDNLSGAGGNDTLLGGAGNDTLTGEGGPDNLSGGEGNDVIQLLAGDLVDGELIDGGTGADALRTLNTGQTLDLTTIANNRIVGIEAIHLAGTSNALTLNLGDVLDLSATSNTVRVDGDGDDTVNSLGQGWMLNQNQVTIDAQTYNTYVQGLATLLVDADITQNIS